MQPNEHDALIPCPHCHQHHHQQDTVCPHCGARLTAAKNADKESGGGRRSKLGRVMYGPPNKPDAVAEDRFQEGPGGQHTEQPRDRDESQRKMDGPAPCDAATQRAMYGPSPHQRVAIRPMGLPWPAVLLTLGVLLVLGWLLVSWLS